MLFLSLTKLIIHFGLFTRAIALSSFELTIANYDLAPDGFNRSTTLAGGTFPGPLISSTKGDTYTINVQNNLTDTSMMLAATVHWHGIFQENNPLNDGVAFVTQCPIAPNTSFPYTFPVPDQTGTYWYHSHYAAQYGDGLRGPFVIYDPADPSASLYDVDDETTIITLADWYHTPSLLETTAFPLPDSNLINGIGRYPNGLSIALSVLSVASGQRYRFRLINMAMEANFNFSIDSHTFTVIEADGINTEPLAVDSLQIFAGQRYSIVLEANQAIGNYWIRADPSVGPAGFDGGINSAILRYEGAADEDPTSETTSTNPLNEYNLHPLENPGAPGTPEPGGADININLDQEFNAAANNFSINGASFKPTSIPVLLQILNKLLPPFIQPNISIYTLPPNKTVEVSIPALSVGGPHPFHLHGHAFDVVRVAGSDEYNYVNPVRRDTVSTGSSSDNVTIRFTTDNPGPWILHCHIDWHLEAGLAVVFVEDEADIEESVSIPDNYEDLCQEYYGVRIPQPLSST